MDNQQQKVEKLLIFSTPTNTHRIDIEAIISVLQQHNDSTKF